MYLPLPLPSPLPVPPVDIPERPFPDWEDEDEAAPRIPLKAFAVWYLLLAAILLGGANIGWWGWGVR